MEPITIAAIAMGGTGLGLQMKGKMEAGKAAEQRAKDEAAWQEYEAKRAEREAEERLASAAHEEKIHRKAGERLKAKHRTQAGQAGIEPIGSFALMEEQTADELEKDALEIRRGGMVGAQSLTAEAQLSRMTGRSALLRGRSARRAGRTGAFASGLSGASALAYQYKMS